MGTITADGGPFTGTQSWSVGDVTRTRSCAGAFVKAACEGRRRARLDMLLVSCAAASTDTRI